MAKKKSGLGWLVNMVTVVPSILKVATHFVACLEREAGLAKKSLITIAILFLIALSLLTMTWCCLCAILFLLLISWQLSFMASLLIVFAINVLLLIIIGISIARVKENLFFPATRHLFR